MAARGKTITVTPDGELAHLLDEALTMPLRLAFRGVHYRLDREATWPEYDSEQARRIVRETAGSWFAVDADAPIADVYHAREEGSRPADRP